MSTHPNALHSNTFSPDYADALQQLAAAQTTSIAPHTMNEQRVWVRKAGRSKFPLGAHMVNVLASTIRLPALKAVPNSGGENVIQTEAKRLQSLQTSGVAVPTLLAVQENALMIEHLNGLDFEQLFKVEAPQGNALDVWQEGLAAIREVHAKNQYLSQCFARNMIHTAAGVFFIDFEDDPRDYLSLPVCQARDWLCFLHSAARFLDDNDKIRHAAATRLTDAMSSDSDAVTQHVKRTLAVLKPLGYLHHNRWGSDTLRLAAMARVSRHRLR